jgi:Fe-S oxidoreductase
MQTRVRHPRAPRQFAVQPAQQDSGHLAAVEAFLYEEQTRRGISIKHWEEFEDVADHCTVCHKCLSPCPVKIDFGDVSMNMRNLLRKMGQRSISAR